MRCATTTKTPSTSLHILWKTVLGVFVKSRQISGATARWVSPIAVRRRAKRLLLSLLILFDPKSARDLTLLYHRPKKRYQVHNPSMLEKRAKL